MYFEIAENADSNDRRIIAACQRTIAAAQELQKRLDRLSMLIANGYGCEQCQAADEKLVGILQDLHEIGSELTLMSDDEAEIRLEQLLTNAA